MVFDLIEKYIRQAQHLKNLSLNFFRATGLFQYLMKTCFQGGIERDQWQEMSQIEFYRSRFFRSSKYEHTKQIWNVRDQEHLFQQYLKLSDETYMMSSVIC